MKNFTKTKFLLSCLLCIILHNTINSQEREKTEIEKKLEAHIENINNDLNKKSSSLDQKIFCNLDQFSNKETITEADAKAIKAKNNTKTVTYIEKEKEGVNTNDTQSSAEFISNLGSAKTKDNRITIQGALSRPDIPDAGFETREINITEDNGSIPLSTPLLFDKPFQKIKTLVTIGDGPHGSSGTAKGDVDFYKAALKRGEAIEFNATAIANAKVNLASLLFNEQGKLLQFNLSRTSPKTTIYFEAPTNGNYYFAVLDFQMLIQLNPNSLNPFNSAFPTVNGNEGDYEVEFVFFGDKIDKDFYAFRLEKGDVLGVAVDSKTSKNIELLTADMKSEIFSNDNDARVIYPKDSPLPRKGVSTLSYIAPENGIYSLSVSNLPETYQMEILVSRPGFELKKNAGTTQVIYLNFAGVKEFTQKEFFNGSPRIDGVPEEELNKKREVSPLGDFLKAWGIKDTPYDRFSLAARITEVVKENLKIDFLESDINPNFDVVILSDYGNKYLADYIPNFLNTIKMPFSKVIIGGTIEELGFTTIGTASTIDPGNFLPTDQAVVLLDILSGTSSIPGANNAFSLNTYPIVEDKEKEELVAVAIGNIATHEIGHFIGCSHTSNTNNVSSMMDQASRFNAVGVFGDGKFGDENTVDVDFVKDIYDSRSGSLVGINHTDVQVAYALSTFSFYDYYSSKKSTQLDVLKQEIANIINKPINFSEEISSYPNPQNSNEVSRLTFTSNLDGDASVILYDIQGREIKSLFSGKINTGQTKEITLNPIALNLKSGIYIYHIKTPQGGKHHRIIIN